ncbi:hypothetical protein EMIHUDRAFT_197006 [Emiliania huxleyi CCMP1516]|uniref:Isochorismatase-like domain-containing protein n=2 Tax=Emiliania huxleyi TaxID=2903 RepID=A0A0D3ITJ4_EMIH1|nr:hypothetical protein EMIHUDRAFT_197006 [Emiliania huxleyi CCMP1516]EOD14579.1 hypothetical protein EMIHUDRAFT_197006 [Emiliania huxleyi CCMP1516]|eukprot:XP_005767008.1 hypothetical protein EMIHUDRAFT_197006 [Emiliania huxleyi CCMP1516]
MGECLRAEARGLNLGRTSWHYDEGRLHQYRYKPAPSVGPPSSAMEAALRLPNPSPAPLTADGRAALIVVDVQTCWWSLSPCGLARAAFPNLPQRTAALLAMARVHGVPIVHVRANYEGSPHVATMRRLNPSLNTVPILPDSEAWARERPGEPVVFKSTFDGFFRTELEACLCRMGVTRASLSPCSTLDDLQGSLFAAHRAPGR